MNGIEILTSNLTANGDRVIGPLGKVLAGLAISLGILGTSRGLSIRKIPIFMADQDLIV